MPSLSSLFARALPVIAYSPKGFRVMMAKARYAHLSMKGVRPALYNLRDFYWDGAFDINEQVNRSATYRADVPGNDTWGAWEVVDGVRVGDCENFATHKLQLAMARGYNRGALRLATCLTERGEPHCVLLMYLSDGDAVILDNRTDALWRKSMRPGYTWLSEEWPGHGYWWKKMSNKDLKS